jgi:hypothetical protein
MQTLREAKRLFRFINTSKARFPAPKTALLFSGLSINVK